MSVGFWSLLRWDLRHLSRQPVLWIALALLGAAMAFGTHNGAALHRAQAQAQMREQADDARWLASTEAKAASYARQASTPLPYWQDPTDVAGFSRYFLRQHAIKPHVSISILAVGQSDVLPSRLPLKLETPFAIAPVYDFEHPRGLALGRFDLGFVIAHVLPIVVMLVMVLLATFERDTGVLRLVAAQQVRPQIWLAARIGAIGAWLLLAVALLVPASLAFAGVDIVQAWPDVGTSLVLVLAYAAFWMTTSAVVVASWPRAAGALGVLVALWAVLGIAAPIAGRSITDAWVPPPSGVAMIDLQRRTADAIEARRDVLVSDAFRARPDLAGHLERIGDIDYSTRMTLLTPIIEARLAPLHRQQSQARATRDRLSDVAGYLLPPLGIESALSTLAGTDVARHREFEVQTRAHQQRLRAWFYARVQGQITAPTPRPAGSYARMNFTEFDAIPSFQWREPSNSVRLRAGVAMTIWLLVVSMLLACVAWIRARRWPAEL